MALRLGCTALLYATQAGSCDAGDEQAERKECGAAQEEHDDVQAVRFVDRHRASAEVREPGGIEQGSCIDVQDGAGQHAEP